MEGVDLMYHKYLDTVRLKNSSEDSSKTAKDFLKNYSIKAGIILSDSRHSDEDKNEVRKMGREIDPENSLYQKMEIEPELVE